VTDISHAELVNLLRDETYTDWKLEADAADLIEQQAKQLAAAEAKIAQALRIPQRHEVVPIDEPVRRHAFLKGYEQAWDDFHAVLEGPVSALDAVRAEAWDEGAQAVRDRIEQYNDRSMDDPDNPYRAAQTGATDGHQ
jgi:hypothetical protein